MASLPSSVPVKKKKASQKPSRTTRIVKKPTRASNKKRSRDPEAKADKTKPKAKCSSKQPRRNTRYNLRSSEEKLPEHVEAEQKLPEHVEGKEKLPEHVDAEQKLPEHVEGKEKLPESAEAEAKTVKSESPLGNPQEPPLLSEKDAQSLQSVFKEVMASVSRKIRNQAASFPLAPSETKTGSNNTVYPNNALYRSENLVAVKILLHVEPPNNVKTIINDILDTRPSQERQAELHVIGQRFRDSCLRNVRAQVGEDSELSPLYIAISALCDDKLCVRQRAVWREGLQPVIPQQSRLNLRNLTRKIQQSEVEYVSAINLATLPRKRKLETIQESVVQNDNPSKLPLANTSTLPVNNLQRSSKMPPPQAPDPMKAEGCSPIKTPNPDIQIGINLEALISALSSRGLEKEDATQFITLLKNRMPESESDRSLEPTLPLVPAPRASDLAFPFAVVEGKAYSTGKQIHEAENQAAVAMACAHNLLHRLDHLADERITNIQPHVLFSITTEGPIHELWAHWTVVEGGLRRFESKSWDSWNVLISGRAEDFMIKLHSVCYWGTAQFLTTVVERLGKVARMTMEPEAQE